MGQTTLNGKASAALSRGARACLWYSDRRTASTRRTIRCSRWTLTQRMRGLPVLRLRREEMKPLLDTWGLEAIAPKRSIMTCTPLTPASRGHRALCRASLD